MMMSTNMLTFKVTRKKPELIPPAKPTPHEFKPLSDIDDQEGFRFQVPIIQLYRKNPSMEGKDPVGIIRAAVAKALVFYYPFAGRLREFFCRKLVVECTGDGVVFIEADADVTLQQFGGGDSLYPPFPNLEELLYDVPGSSGIIDSPLLLIQATRLKCGGFIFALRFNHTMCNTVGIAQFISAVGQLARGSEAPTIQPIWQRHLLNARQPPRVTCTHHEYDSLPNVEGTGIPLDDMEQHSFFFNAGDIAALRYNLPPHLHCCSKFELVTSYIWRCRTIALSPNPDEEVRFLCIVDARKRLNPPLPDGYYGNAVVVPAAITTANKLTKNPLHYVVELVRKAKSKATEEYVRSVADLMVVRGRPHFTVARSYMVLDVTHAGLSEADFGWGQATYGGVAKIGIGLFPGVISLFTSFKNNKGEDGALALVCLPSNTMKVFEKELEMMMMAAQKSLISNASAL